MEGLDEFYIVIIIGREPEQTITRNTAQRTGHEAMPEARARPAREAERFRQLVAANRWFFDRLAQLDAPNWRLYEEWRGLSDSVRLRRFMREERITEPETSDA